MHSSPFDATYEELLDGLDAYVDSVVSNLASDFLSMPKGQGFLEYPVFEAGFEALKKATRNFEELRVDNVMNCIEGCRVSLLVLRAMLGISPPEWAYLAKAKSGLDVGQGHARSLEGAIRDAPLLPMKTNARSRARLIAMIEVACEMLNAKDRAGEPDRLHRLDKADTMDGLDSIRSMAILGAPYPVLLYERILGRPFAAHRDSVSEMIGDALEAPIETLLVAAGISFRKTRRAEKLAGFDQAPDFIVPNEFNPGAVIEAKICEDDGTARDKVTRIQHLASIASARVAQGLPGFEVIACISGRGFGVRREDMKKLLLATRGKVFTIRTIPAMIAATSLRNYVSRSTHTDH